MNDTTKEVQPSTQHQAENTYELDLHTIARLTFRTSPWLFFTIIAAFAASISFSIAKYYELKGLITDTNHKIELLRTEIKGNIDLLKLQMNNKEVSRSSEGGQPQPHN